MTFDGLRALVTGGASGIGEAAARRLHDHGARVAVLDLDVSGVREPFVAVRADVTDDAAVRAAVDEAAQRLGGLDLLVNNAGIGMRTVNPRFLEEPQPFWAVPVEGFRDVFETKVTGCFLVAAAVVPRMLAADGGRVVNISMNESTMVRRGFVPYGPSGAAVEALSRVMAADLADSSVRVNLLLPGGATATGMVPSEGVPEELRSSLLSPDVMGPPIAWLASPEAADVHDERIVAAEWRPGAH
jgi:NAD(P)-dependent dehydrogenase (short-subunit alcohol dehydrogenase family)